jgi:hypothetical protein
MPDTGVLIFATDLQGNLKDYERLKEIYRKEEKDGNEPVLAFCGDLVHGPSPDLNEPGAWPEHLGTPYVDESVALLTDFEEFSRSARAFSLIGNHEHAHIGGPIVAKFYEDEAAVLDEKLGEDGERLRSFMETFPLIAVGRCGAVLTHGAPMAAEDSLEDFEKLSYRGYEAVAIDYMSRRDTLGALLWSRRASAEQAAELLRVAGLNGKPAAFVAHGHDVVHHGYETQGQEQICVSTSFGLLDANKVYLRLDLSRRYEAVTDLRQGHEILHLYP